MAQTTTTQETEAPKAMNPFVARFRGHEIIDGSNQADLAVTVANIVYGLVGFGGARILKSTALKNTKLGKFSLIDKIKAGSPKKNNG